MKEILRYRRIIIKHIKRFKERILENNFKPSIFPKEFLIPGRNEIKLLEEKIIILDEKIKKLKNMKDSNKKITDFI